MKHLTITACILLVLFVVLACQPTVYAEVSLDTRGSNIVEVVVTGPNVMSAERIKLILRTKEGTTYDPDIADKDMKELYARNLVEEVTVTVERVEGGVKVTFRIIEKRVIAEIVFLPGDLYYTKNRLTETIVTKPGEYYSFAISAQDEEMIRAEFKKKGFLKIDVSHTITVAPGGLKLTYNISQGQRYAIGDIVFDGNTVFTSRKLRKAMTNKRKSLFTGGYMKELELEVDIDRIRAMYLDKGYLDVKVELRPVILPEPPSDFNPEKKFLFSIHIQITEGTHYRVASLSFTGDTVFTEEELYKCLVINTGDFAELGLIDKSITNIVDMFGEQGRAFTDIQPEIVPTDSDDMVDVIFHIRQSDVISVNEVIIQGNDVTMEKVIRREIRVYPGEYLRMKDMRDSFRNLNNLGYFSNITASYNRRGDNLTDVVFSVEEGKTGRFMFGGGVTSDADVFFSLSYIETNFDIAGWPKMRGAGQNFKASANIGTSMTAFMLDFVEPHVFDSDYSFGIGTARTQYERDAFDDTRIEFHLSIGKRFTDVFSASLVYTYEYVEIDDISATAPAAIQLDEGKHNLGSLGLRTRFRNVDNPYVPTDGYDVRADVYIYNSILGSDYDFYKVSIRAARFFNIFTTKNGSPHTLETSLMLGYMDPMGDTDVIPTFERFYCGGAGSVRGWQPREIGPRIGQDPIGGYFVTAASLEYYFPVFSDVFYLACFFDAGGAWDEMGNFDSDGLRYGTGVGFYIKTPLSQAPFRIYFCDALNPKTGEDDQLISFSLGFTF